MLSFSMKNFSSGVRLVSAAFLAVSIALVSGCSSGLPLPGGDTSAPNQPDPLQPLDWEVIELATVKVGQASSNSTFQTDDELWFSGSVLGNTVLYKTTDGATFTKQSVGDGVIEEYARIGSTIVGVGRANNQAVVHRSTDGGKKWEVLRPKAMRISKAEVWLESVTVHNGQFVAAGTARSAKWDARLWTSKDGKNWTAAGTFRDKHPTSAAKVISDGNTLVFATAEHYCSETSVNSSAGGWYLGSWVDYLRVRQGPDAGSLVKQTDEQNPLILDPDIDCSVTTAFALDDPEIMFDNAILFSDQIVFLVQIINSEKKRAYAIAKLDGSSWQFTEPSVLQENVTLSSKAQLMVLDNKLAVFWASRYAQNTQMWKNVAWQDGEQWLSFGGNADDQTSAISIATEFKGRVYAWGNYFTPGGKSGDPMPWRLYRSAQIGD
ncbi:MAG: hypothetical protein KF916_00070 [Microbacteriaceae bacterium]|nr:hypothetical protein [Microbacteriaceae bacterium]